MHKTVCRICLRSDFTNSGVVDATFIDFHNELCDFEVCSDSELSFCPICAHLLRKFYDFREKCKEAHLVLKTMKHRKAPLHELLKHVPPSPIGFCLPSSRQKVYDINCSLELKLESKTPVISIPIKEKNTTNNFKEKKMKVDLERCDEVNMETEIQEEVIEESIEEIAEYLEIEQDDIYEVNDSNDDYGSKSDDELDFLGSDFDNEDRKLIMKILSEPKKPNVPSDDFHGDLLNDKHMEQIAMRYVEKVYNTKKLFVRRTLEMKERVLELLEKGALDDLPEKIDKEMVLKMFSQCSMTFWRSQVPNRNDPSYLKTIKDFLQRLLKRYHPKYERVFKVQCLNTLSDKQAEVESRKNSDHYMNAEFKCEICYRVFETEKSLNYHNKWHEPSVGRPHLCPLCRMRFTQRKILRRHLLESHVILYKCRMCPLVTTIHSVMVDHYQRHVGIKYECPTCYEEFSTRSCYYIHQTTHEATCHVCMFCAKRSLSEIGLRQHVNKAHYGVSIPTNLIKCEYCEAKLVSAEMVDIHIKDTHEQNCKGTRKRQISNFTGSAQAKRKQDRRDPVRSNPSFRTCPVCGVNVPNVCKTALFDHHQQNHPELAYVSNNTKYLCEHCGRAFQSVTMYSDHLNTHTGARPYACPMCDARYATSNQLVQHKNRRHEDPKYMCPFCGKMFKTSSNLFNHKRIHIRDRRFKCEICSKGFIHRGAMREHVNGVHHLIRRVKKKPNKSTPNKQSPGKPNKLTYTRLSDEE